MFYSSKKMKCNSNCKIPVGGAAVVLVVSTVAGVILTWLGTLVGGFQTERNIIYEFLGT